MCLFEEEHWSLGPGGESDDFSDICLIISWHDTPPPSLEFHSPSSVTTLTPLPKISLTKISAQNLLSEEILAGKPRETKILSQMFAGLPEIAAQPADFTNESEIDNVGYLLNPTRKYTYMKNELGFVPDDLTRFRSLHEQYLATVDPININLTQI